MKNYNIIFNGSHVQTITATQFFKTEFGQTEFYLNGVSICIVPKEYMIIETQDSTKYQSTLKSIICQLKSVLNNDIERVLPEFKDLNSWKETQQHLWLNEFEILYNETFKD